MKLQKIGILAITLFTLNSQAMEKSCTPIDGLSKDKTSYYSWLPKELREEVCKFVINNSLAVKWALHKHAESVGFGAKRLEVYEGHIDYWARCFAVANNRHISGSSDFMIKIWNLETWQCERALLGHTDWIRCLAVANNRLISGSDDRTIKIWNLETWQCEKTLRGHTGAIKCLTVLNNRIISGSDDRTIKIWNLKDGDCCYSLNVSRGFIEHIDVAAEYAYRIDGNKIMMYTLEDPTIKKELHPNMDTVNLMESAYECSQNNKALDLRTNPCLHTAFTRLPVALQKVIQKEITVQLPS